MQFYTCWLDPGVVSEEEPGRICYAEAMYWVQRW